MAVKIYNTLTRKKEVFKAIRKNQIGLYTCGPTVYNYAHIGNLRTYIFEDILKRVLKYNNYKVKHVMNITDVGHLTSDADAGEDKIEKQAKKKKKTVWDIARFYTRAFKQDIKKLNIQEPDIWCRATQHIKEQISLIEKLEKNGYTYQTNEAVYFNTSKLKDYGKLAGLQLVKLKPGARVKVDTKKKSPYDFVLWFKLVGKHKNHIMNWPSPWGKGFPGWHIECSAMAIKYLGKTLDIHCGGIDHIPVHHTNEIAQSETGTGKKFVNYWLHGEFLIINKSRMGKSEKNFITLQDLIAKGFNPLAYRYLCLSAHYRSKLNFSWQDLQAAQNGLDNLYKTVADYPRASSISFGHQKQFLEAINDDLDTPKAIAFIWRLIKNKNIPSSQKKAALLKFDQVLGLGLDKVKKKRLVIPQEIKKLIKEREQTRQNKNWQKADRIRKQIEEKGYQIKDTKQGAKLINVK